MKEAFAILNRFFDHVYVITLERARDRHAHIASELDGLDYELFYGKDKLQFDVEELKRTGIYDEALARRHHRYGKPLPPGMIGCSWSHLLVYEDMLAKGYEKVLVLEDDVVIDRQAATHLAGALAELPTDWELLYLGFAANERPSRFHFLKQAVYHLQHAIGHLKYSHRTIRNLYPRPYGRHLYKAGYHDCTHAYGLTRPAAEQLAALQRPISFLPDNLLAHAVSNELINAFLVQPRIINQLYQVTEGPVHSYINH